MEIVRGALADPHPHMPTETQMRGEEALARLTERIAELERKQRLTRLSSLTS